MPLLAEPNPSWPEQFALESRRLKDALGALALRVEHVGSTSVSGLTAKPIIDIQVSVGSLADLEPFIAPLRSLGYHHLPLPDPPPDVYPFFHRPDGWPSTHHVHLCVIGGQEERRHLGFRDWLRAHPEDRDRYAELKRSLSEGLDPSDVLAVMSYTNQKGDFVREIERRFMETEAES